MFFEDLTLPSLRDTSPKGEAYKQIAFAFVQLSVIILLTSWAPSDEGAVRRTEGEIDFAKKEQVMCSTFLSFRLLLRKTRLPRRREAEAAVSFYNYLKIFSFTKESIYSHTP